MKRLEKFSLVLIYNEEIVFKSTRERVKPLFDCVKRNRHDYSGCTLYYRVIGLAAARLVVFSGMIHIVNTPLVSRPAKNLLLYHNINLYTVKTVEHILNEDKSDICLMEKMATASLNNDDLYYKLEEFFKTP